MKQLLTKYPIFTKLPQIPRIRINRNFSSIYNSWLGGGVRGHLCFTQSAMILLLYMSSAFRKTCVIDLTFFYRGRQINYFWSYLSSRGS